MANVVGRDILVRMLGDVDELKRSQAVMADAIAELRRAELRTAEVLRTIADEIDTGQRAFSKLRGGIEALIDAAGDVEARVDDHEERLRALEAKSGA